MLILRGVRGLLSPSSHLLIQSLVGRVGRYVFRIAAGRAEAERLAGVQAGRIRRPSG